MGRPAEEDGFSGATLAQEEDNTLGRRELGGLRLDRGCDEGPKDNGALAMCLILRRGHSRAMSVSPREYKGEPYSKEPAFG